MSISELRPLCRKCHTTGSIDCSECLDAARFKAYREEITRLTRELAEARSQRGALLPWVHVWDDRNHCRQCDGHGRHLPDCKLKAALDAAKGGA